MVLLLVSIVGKLEKKGGLVVFLASKHYLETPLKSWEISEGNNYVHYKALIPSIWESLKQGYDILMIIKKAWNGSGLLVV